MSAGDKKIRIEFDNVVWEVALLDGPVSMPFTPRAEASLDLVVVDWQDVAERIAADILSRDAFTKREPVVFEAKAELKTPLSRFAQRI